MGILNLFKRKLEKTYSKQTSMSFKHENNLYSKGSIYTRKDFTSKRGNEYTRLDYYDAESTSKLFYDSTRLIYKKEPIILQSGNTVYDASVAWYKHNDNNDNIYQLYDICLGLDLDKVYNDLDYVRFLMTKLLEQKRIISFLQDSLDNISVSGNYIGYVDISDLVDAYRQEEKIYTYNIGFNDKDAEEIQSSRQQTALREKNNSDRIYKLFNDERFEI